MHLPSFAAVVDHDGVHSASAEEGHASAIVEGRPFVVGAAGGPSTFLAAQHSLVAADHGVSLLVVGLDDLVAVVRILGQRSCREAVVEISDDVVR